MIVFCCSLCYLPNLPIEVLRCPRCGGEDFLPEYGTLSGPEHHLKPINDTTSFCDPFTEPIGEAKAMSAGCSSNKHEQTEVIIKDISFSSEERLDGLNRTNVEGEREECAEPINLPCQNTNLKQEQKFQICYNDPVLKNNALQEIPNAYGQAYYFNAEDNDVIDSASPNISATVGAHGEERQNHQPQNKRENKPSVEVGVQELSQFKNESGEIDFAGCSKCLGRFSKGQLSYDGDSKPYKCEKCLCSFSESKLLNRHQKVHSNERPFKCGQCDYTSERSATFNRHVLTHHAKRENKSSAEVASGVNEYSQFKNEDGEIDFAGCNKCLKQFREGQLSFNVDPKAFKCEKCLCRFAEHWLLKRHLAVHSKDTPFKCGQCGFCSKWKDNLDTHILTYHMKQ